MMCREDLVKMNVKELLIIAKEIKIVGRHEMKKSELIEAIASKDSKVVNVAPISSTSVVKITRQHSDVEQALTKEAKEVWEDSSNVCEIINLPKPREQYIDNAKVGTIIAFKVNESKVISGMIEEIHKSDFLVKTRNGVQFTVRKRHIIWVKTGPRWPKGVYLALKGETQDGKCKAAN